AVRRRLGLGQQGGGGFGGLGGGGGGFFSVPGDSDSARTPTTGSTAPSAHAKPKVSSAPVQAIIVDKSVSPDEFWNGYFSRQEADPAVVRATVRQLMGQKQHDQVIALVYAALRNGQPQPWMYESLGIAMELAGRSKPEIERAVMSAADFSTVPDELMYIAQYLSRLSLNRRAMQLYQQVAKLEPLRGDAYALGLRSAQQCDDLAGIEWATIGILSQAWPNDEAAIQLTASRVAKATLARLESEGKSAERDTYLKQLQDAVVWDCVVQVSWTGNADVDLTVEEPSGTVCSSAEPRTSGGGVALGDSYAAGGDGSGEVFTETYACPRGFVGTYRARIHRVLGEVTAGKVTVDVYTHLRSGDVQHERQQLALDDKDAMVVFNLDKGQRTEPIEESQLAGAVKRQESVSRAVLAQQLSSGSDDHVLPVRPINDFARRAMFGRGAVGFQPIIETLPEGTMLAATGVVSADRRYVRITAAPIFSSIGDVQTFTFAGEAEEVDNNMPTVPEGPEVEPPILNQGGGGFGGR
ncbi:MAG: hypothetical protein WD176_10850, partial [Pirellulales bacterium]